MDSADTIWSFDTALALTFSVQIISRIGKGKYWLVQVSKSILFPEKQTDIKVEFLENGKVCASWDEQQAV